MRIAVYTMAKNEAAEVVGWCENTSEADVRCVLDTGSTDGTPDLLRSQGVTVYPGWVDPWRFDTARNASMALIPWDIDVCVKLDMDERLSADWRKDVEASWKEGTTRLEYEYVWSWYGPGQPRVHFKSDLIHGRRGYIWRHPAHEGLYAHSIFETKADCAVVIGHYQKERVRPDDLALLAVGVQECRCSRTLFYLAREFYFRGMWGQAVMLFAEYMVAKDSVWPAEKVQALAWMSDCYERLKAKGELASDPRVPNLDGANVHPRG